MQIHRLVSDSNDGPNVLDLHSHLTVISSADAERRRGAFERVYRALRGEAGQHIEAMTEYGDRITAFRPAAGKPTLVDTVRDTPVAPGTRGLGIVAQLNSPDAMASHLRLLHVSKRSLLDRVMSDSDMIALAKTPIDQVWALANNIQADRDTLSHTRDRGSNITAQAEERESREEEVAAIVAQRDEEERKAKFMLIAAAVILVIGAASTILVSPTIGGIFTLLAVGVAGAGVYLRRATDTVEEGAEFEETELGVQMGRIDELFDNHTVSRKEREAQENLNNSLRLWSNLAGSAEPEVLIKERTRIEELAGYIRLIDAVSSDDAHRSHIDQEALYGFASLLAELSRRFPAERVPLLIDDLFADIDPIFHSVLRDLIIRASHRRQVLLESADVEVCRWAAAEAVTGGALLITDQEVAFDPDVVDVAHDDPAEHHAA
ncbi:MAG: hypothetical protein ACR2P0_15440 [Acidimicrobiales bacterium]